MRLPRFTDAEILARRGAKNGLDVDRPYGFFVEHEYSRFGTIEPTAVILLTNRECPFRCLMCDLWKNTLDFRVPSGAIGRQIDYALSRLPEVRHVKLYNSGNFFDPKAIPPEDLEDIASRLQGMRTVIVENHPLLCDEACCDFRDMLPDDCELEIAIGLETIQPQVLERLNKRMSLDDFMTAVAFLGRNHILTRAFILLRPPFMTEAEGREWALKSLQLAFATGVGCCSIIPTRDGNGIMEDLKLAGDFSPPHLNSLEWVLESAISWKRGRVFADLWDAESLPSCADCAEPRLERIRELNRTQKVLPPIDCHCDQ